MKMGRIAGIVVAVGVLVGWSAVAWADDDDEGGGGGGGQEDTGGDRDQPDDKPDDPPQPDDTKPDDPPQPDDTKPDDPPQPDDQPGDQAGAATGDADGDGTPDAAEDSDHDGTPDTAEDSDGDGTPDVADADADNDGKPDASEDEDGDGQPDSADTDDDNDGILDSQEGGPGYDPDEDNEGEPPYVEWDADGDGNVEPDEAAFQKEYAEAFDDVPDVITDDALDARPDGQELMPSMSAEDFRKLVRLAKTKVLERLEGKIERKQAKKMLKFTYIVCAVSLLGVFLLFTPLFLKKKYPGQGSTLFKYAGLAALTWFVTVNLFGGVLYGMRTVQGALSSFTNPQLAIAGGLFDTLDEHAERYITTGKELFAPTLEQLQGNIDDQPAAVLLENGMKIVGDAKVFKSMAGLVKKVDWIFAMLPIVLLLVTMLLFVLAIKPTLVEIIKLPMRAASGDAGAGKEVMRKSMRRVVGEMKATLCTLGVLAVLSIISGLVLGMIVGPVLDGLLYYFSLAINYLQFQEGASSGLVFIALFGVIFFLVLNLATLILSMAFFLGKSQKIFQQRFNEDVPLVRHKSFFKWGIPAVLFVQVFPLLFVLIASRALGALNESLTSGAATASAINWKALLLGGPLALVFGYLLLFWAARGVKAIGFLFAYKPKKVLEAQANSPRAGGV